MDFDAAPVAPIALSGDSIPVIDLGGVWSGSSEEIGRACAEWGFFQIVGHGIDPDLVNAMSEQTRRFFARRSEQKRRFSRSRDNPWGYYDRELTKNARDKKEIFDIGPAGTDSVSVDPFEGDTPWPDDDFASVARSYFAACEAISGKLIDDIFRSLGVPADAMQVAFEPTHTSFLRLNYYPVDDPLGEDADGGADLGIHHHTDAGALTVLLQDQIRGLQVYRDGVWHSVEPLKGALVINIGDMVEVWSNGLYPAALHRVLAMEHADRYSIAFFYNPSYQAVVTPLDAVLNTQAPAQFRAISWGEFRRRRADGDYANYGAEVQIADYRLTGDV
jgi:isopenicillin N synthase-like dioxygenase